MPARIGREALFVVFLLFGSLAQAQQYEVNAWPARQALPALSATDVDGKAWRLQDLRGRAVLLNFWATWCEPCRSEMPQLQVVSDLYGPDKLVVLTLNFKEPASRVRQFARNAGLQMPLLLDPAGEWAKAFGVKVFPTTVLIGADGTPRQRVRGEVDWSSTEAEKLLAPLWVSQRR